MASLSVPIALSAGLLAGLLLGTLRNVSVPTSPQEDNIRHGYFDVTYRESDVYGYQEDNMRTENGTHFLLMDDDALHNDDDSIAKELYENVRVLCWIMTSQKNLQNKAIHVKNTWARRCNILLFMSDKADPDLPAVGLDTELGREHLTAKTMRAFDYVYKHHIDDADWFMKADDDTYVIVENLRYMLSAHAPSDPIYFGHRFHFFVKQGYNSGGAGYVLSKEALRRFGQRPTGLCAVDYGAEDVQMGRCLEKLRVMIGDSRDRLNRSRFHISPPALHLSGYYPSWYLKYDAYGAQMGIESISDYPVSFHHVSADLMYELEYMFYHLSTYGLLRGLQSVNRIATVTTAAEHQTDSNMVTDR